MYISRLMNSVCLFVWKSYIADFLISTPSHSFLFIIMFIIIDYSYSKTSLWNPFWLSNVFFSIAGDYVYVYMLNSSPLIRHFRKLYLTITYEMTMSITGKLTCGSSRNTQWLERSDYMLNQTNQWENICNFNVKLAIY